MILEISKQKVMCCGNACGPVLCFTVEWQKGPDTSLVE